jgi:hypothetical protein
MKENIWSLMMGFPEPRILKKFKKKNIVTHIHTINAMLGLQFNVNPLIRYKIFIVSRDNPCALTQNIFYYFLVRYNCSHKLNYLIK